MNLADLACAVLKTADTLGVPHMVVGAIAAGSYGIPRATKDIDLLVTLDLKNGIHQLMGALDDLVEFEGQAQFDTITWGKRYVGTHRGDPPFKVELFEMFDDPFVVSEFGRKVRRFVPILQKEVWVPTAEDVVVQKIRWGRNKDLDDARDVLAVQGVETLDMGYVRKWCEAHGTVERLEGILRELPEF